MQHRTTAAVAPPLPRVRRMRGAARIALLAVVSGLLVGGNLLGLNLLGGPEANPAAAATASANVRAVLPMQEAEARETAPGDEDEEEPAEFTITSPASGAFINTNTLTVSGRGTEEGASVSVTAGGDQVCGEQGARVVNRDGALVWSCQATGVANGQARTLTATETASDGTRIATVEVSVLGPPRLDGATLTTGVITGHSVARATISVTLAGGAGSCTTTATGSGYWSCVPSTSGGGRVAAGTHTVNARQAWAPGGNQSAPASRTIEIDNVAPASPVILQPAGDYRLHSLPTTFSGTGESGATVTVYLGGVPVCTAPVSQNTWACVGGSTLAHAAHQMNAIQVDRAGNHSNPSANIRVFFGPPRSTGAPTAPTTPEPTTEPSPDPTPDATPEPDDEGVDGSAPPFSDGSAGGGWTSGGIPPPRFSGDAGPDALTNWGASTEFGIGIPTFTETLERGNWTRAPLLAAAAILLIALPLRLLANALRGRRLLPKAQFTGRNRGFVPATKSLTTEANPWLGIIGPFLVTVGFMVVASGVKGEVRYLRLAIAVAGALAVLNLVGVAIATRVGRAWQGVEGQVRFRPLLLALAIVSGLLSRAIGLVPPFVTGTLVGLRTPYDTPVHKRAAVHFVKVGTILSLGLAGWIGHSTLGPVSGFWGNLASEFLAALCLVGVGSAVALLIPVAVLPGRVLWEWKPWTWFLVAFPVTTVAFILGLGGPMGNFPAAAMLFVGGGIAVLCLAGWTILRFILPRDIASRVAPAPAR